MQHTLRPVASSLLCPAAPLCAAAAASLMPGGATCWWQGPVSRLAVSAVPASDASRWGRQNFPRFAGEVHSCELLLSSAAYVQADCAEVPPSGVPLSAMPAGSAVSPAGRWLMPWDLSGAEIPPWAAAAA